MKQNDKKKNQATPEYFHRYYDKLCFLHSIDFVKYNPYIKYISLN